MSADRILLDYRGHKCPAPVIALGRQASATPGALVELLADDPAARFDVPAWCRMRAAHLEITTDSRSAAGESWLTFRITLPTAG